MCSPGFSTRTWGQGRWAGTTPTASIMCGVAPPATVRLELWAGPPHGRARQGPARRLFIRALYWRRSDRVTVVSALPLSRGGPRWSRASETRAPLTENKCLQGISGQVYYFPCMPIFSTLGAGTVWGALDISRSGPWRNPGDTLIGGHLPFAEGGTTAGRTPEETIGIYNRPAKRLPPAVGVAQRVSTSSVFISRWDDNSPWRCTQGIDQGCGVIRGRGTATPLRRAT